jgi:large subunit ribosomal protein L15
MQINTLKLKTRRKKRNFIGRGGKKGTYSGKGNKGQKARSGAKVDPLFEGGRSTLIDHMKKARGFKSIAPRTIVVRIEKMEKKLKGTEEVNKETLVKSGLISKMEAERKVKILGTAELKRKFKVAKEIFVSLSAKKAIEKAGGEVENNKETIEEKGV